MRRILFAAALLISSACYSQNLFENLNLHASKEMAKKFVSNILDYDIMNPVTDSASRKLITYTFSSTGLDEVKVEFWKIRSGDSTKYTIAGIRGKYAPVFYIWKTFFQSDADYPMLEKEKHGKVVQLPSASGRKLTFTISGDGKLWQISCKEL